MVQGGGEVAEAGWLDSARQRRRRVVAGGGSGDFLEQEGEVGGERRPSIWREARGAVLNAVGRGDNGGGGFNSGEKRQAPVVRGGQAATGGREVGYDVLAQLAFTQRGE
jgi:hypothetical protein